MIRQARQFAVVGDAVVVQVLPDGELAERRIGRVDLAVMVGVERRKRRQTVHIAATGKVRREDLAAIVDLAVAVDIEREDAVTAGRPGDLVLVTVGIDVELDAVVERGQRDAVVVEVEDDRVGGVVVAPDIGT